MSQERKRQLQERESLPDILYPRQVLAGQTVGEIKELTNLDSVKLNLRESPSHVEADYGVACFPIAKEWGYSPVEIAEQLVAGLNEDLPELVKKVEAVGPYINFEVNQEEYSQLVIDSVLSLGNDYGKENIGDGEVVVIDMSSPNVAKPMTVAHLRSTVIGHSLGRMFSFSNHEVIRDNHLGDWGTQFGMMLKAHELWGDEVPELRSGDSEAQVHGLYTLYTKIHDEVEKDKEEEKINLNARVREQGIEQFPELTDSYNRHLKKYPEDKAWDMALEDAIPSVELETAGREWFKRLEAGDPVAERKWREMTELSLVEFEKIYDILGVDFDCAIGESFYAQEGWTNRVVDELEEADFVFESDGALVADLDDVGKGKLVVRAEGGRSLYITRDLAAVIYRQEEMDAERILYVVGGEQKHYFEQCFEIAGRMGYEVADNCEHIFFGMLSLPEGKMSTRAGRVVFLKDVLDEGIRRAEKAIRRESRSEITADEMQEIARDVATGAIIWSDLSSDMKRDIKFDWDEILAFEGDSAPYVQYMHVRAKSILEKAKGLSIEKQEAGVEPEEAEVDLVKKLADFPEIVQGAVEQRNPTLVAQYTYELAKFYSGFYHKCRVIGLNDEVNEFRLRLTAASAQVIENGLYLLGISAPNKM